MVKTSVGQISYYYKKSSEFGFFWEELGKKMKPGPLNIKESPDGLKMYLCIPAGNNIVDYSSALRAVDLQSK